MNPAGNEVRINDRSVTLTPVEYRLLYHLASNERRVLSYRELLTKVWGNEYREVVPLLRMHMQHLKQKLGHSIMSSSMITDVADVGYRFVGHLEKVQL